MSVNDFAGVVDQRDETRLEDALRQIYLETMNVVVVVTVETIAPMENVRAYTANYQQAGGQSSFADYYTAAYGYAIFDKTLRENVTFADHSLATDSVFSETQLISCRNVLIYFNKNLQGRAFGLFHESLCHRGFLVLGSKETPDFSAFGDQFEPLVKQERIYRKT